MLKKDNQLLSLALIAVTLFPFTLLAQSITETEAQTINEQTELCDASNLNLTINQKCINSIKQKQLKTIKLSPLPRIENIETNKGINLQGLNPFINGKNAVN